jgi:hypothetical protein
MEATTWRWRRRRTYVSWQCARAEAPPPLVSHGWAWQISWFTVSLVQELQRVRVHDENPAGGPFELRGCAFVTHQSREVESAAGCLGRARAWRRMAMAARRAVVTRWRSGEPRRASGGGTDVAGLRLSARRRLLRLPRASRSGSAPAPGRARTTGSLTADDPTAKRDQGVDGI